MPPTNEAESLSANNGVSVGAFFDVDNTLVPGFAIELHFLRYLWKEGLVGVKDALRSLGFFLRHIPPVSFHPLRERKLYLAGKQRTTIEPLAAKFIRAEICPKLSKDGIAALEAHRRAGHCCVLVTASLDFLVAPLAAFLDVETVLSARPELGGDDYTGHVLPPLPYGEGKRQLVESVAAQEGLDLADSYAYGDSPGDVGLLGAVGHPLVVNPIRGMASIARRRGWPVAKWR
ncbi:MAG TPA: HAD-IB family hydrolase [Nitrospiraceae bacterium]|nr:HAD-IB family hydrolase [Nitrospiraceae bacterium]